MVVTNIGLLSYTSIGIVHELYGISRCSKTLKGIQLTGQVMRFLHNDDTQTDIG
jgi:hypothetical protein